MGGARRGWLVVVAVVPVPVGCEWTHVRGDAALTGRSSASTSISVANVNRLVTEWPSAPFVTAPGDIPTMASRWIQTQQGAYLVAPTGCSTAPVTCAPAWTRSGWTGPATGEAPPTQSGTTSYVLPVSSTVPGATTFSAYSADGTTGCAGAPLV